MNFILLMLILTSSAFAQKSTNFFQNKTKIENPFNLRDPFKPSQAKGDGSKVGGKYTKVGKDQYSNIAPTALNQIQPTQLKLVGVLIGKERRALVNPGNSDTSVVVLKEGMKIGPEASEIKAILPGGIIIVEKIINVYGEEEYLETVIPISR